MNERIIQPVFVNDNKQLKQLSHQWLQLPFIAVDTEFIRTKTFYPKTGLIQVCDGESSYLIDPLLIDEWQDFIEVLVAPHVLKILHSCSEDLVVFQSFFKVCAQPLFDTQVAAAFLNYGQAISYQALVNSMLNINLPKVETLSDWMQRPLSDDQARYAALDVAYLPEIHKRLSALLEQQEKESWLVEECEALVKQSEALASSDYSESYQTIKSAWRLNPLELAILRNLASWREQQCRQRNRPRNWLVQEVVLWSIAKVKPTHITELAAVEGVTKPLLKDAEAILLAVKQALELLPNEHPQQLAKPLSNSSRRILKSLQRYVRERAEALGLAPELLARKRQLVAFLNSGEESDGYQLPLELQGWRKSLLAAELFSKVQEG